MADVDELLIIATRVAQKHNIDSTTIVRSYKTLPMVVGPDRVEVDVVLVLEDGTNYKATISSRIILVDPVVKRFGV